MNILRAGAAAIVAALVITSCGSDSDSDDGGASEPAATAESSGSDGASTEISTVGALGLQVPDGVPAEFPVPADTVVLSVDEGGQSGERLDVHLGTAASRDEVTAAVQPYIESLENGSFSGSSGQGFIDVDGTPTPVQVFVSTTDAEDPPTRITISVPNT